MTKTQKTLDLENKIWKTTSKTGVFGCFEVTIGFNINNTERVDYLTYDTKGIWRCYEIKVSKPDFYSKAKKTFVGHYNYYVMTKELFNDVKNEIPSYIGVYCGSVLVKRPKKQDLQVDEQVLKDSMIRSLYREYQKSYLSKNKNTIDNLKKKLNKIEKERNKIKNDYVNLTNKFICKLGEI